MNFCREFYCLRQYEKAAGCFNEMLKEDPGNVSAQHVLGFIYQQQGMNDAAIEIFEKLPDKNRAFKAVALGYAYARAGRKADALRLLAEVEEMYRNGLVSPYEVAIIYLGLGDKDQA